MLHTTHAGCAHKRHGENHGRQPGDGAENGFASETVVFQKLFPVVFLLLLQGGFSLRRQFRPVTGFANSLDQRLGAYLARIKYHVRVVQHQVYGRVLHARVGIQRAFHKRLAGGTSHSGHGEGHALLTCAGSLFPRF